LHSLLKYINLYSFCSFVFFVLFAAKKKEVMMKYKKRYVRDVILTALMAVFLTGFCIPLFPAAEESEPVSQKIQQWLVLGPAEIPAIEMDRLTSDSAILNFNHLDVSGLMPMEGSKVPWTGGRVLTWKRFENPDFNVKKTAVLYLATYLETDRWLKTRLVLDNKDLKAAVYLDGQSVGTQPDKDKLTADLELTNEKHPLIIKVVLKEGVKLIVNAALETGDPFRNDKIALSLTPLRRLQPDHVLNMIEVTGISVSPDGKRTAAFLKQDRKGTGETDHWTEILNTADGGMVFSSRSLGSISRFRWVGSSNSFSYCVTDKENTSIYQYHLPTHTITPLLKDIKKFSSYWWAPDASYLVYSTYSEKKSDSLYKYVKEIPDRGAFPGYENALYIYFLSGVTGTVHQITDFKQDLGFAAVSPNGKYVLLRKNESDNKNRPYLKNFYYLFDVGAMTLAEKPLLESNWINKVYWSPDAKKLLMLGGPSSFDGLGKNLKEDRIPNDYDVQAYIFDIQTRKPEAISKDFDPSIDNASWSSSLNNIYFTATDKSDKGLFKYSVKKNSCTRFNTKVDVVEEIDFADRGNTAVYWGCSANIPYKLYRINLSNGSAAVLKDYNEDAFKYVKIGDVKEWNFKMPDGTVITGRIHYPVDFAANKKYPCIVYYYGGTSPVERDFAGRYPKNWYTANGYIVYVLQPSGTVGFGQDFSAVHVNDWGKTTTEEVIYGVKQLIKEHPYIDPNRIGAMGASYGGFLTQYIAAHTDIFAAYISHAGISALSSYWGIGDWGYTYNAIAAADSFPWNRKDIYVGHSPLYMADRITRPLLLLHGENDNNVPTGESYQMFAALKLLGKDVELVVIKGQWHWIMEYKKRLLWMRTIIAWWDKYLKNQPQCWENMYEKKN
jgi:dipeptidyl aminopeptidase/acylaminoacyl peptidase